MKKLFMLVSALVLCLSACSSNATPSKSNKEVVKVSEPTKTKDTTKNKEDVEKQSEDKVTIDDKNKDDNSTKKKGDKTSTDKSNTSTNKKPSTSVNSSSTSSKKPSSTTSGKPSSSTSKKPSSNLSDNNTSSNETPSKPESEPHKHFVLNPSEYSGETYYDSTKAFDTCDEMDAWVESLAEQKGWASYQWGGPTCSCGKELVIIYNITYPDTENLWCQDEDGNDYVCGVQ